MSGQEKSLRDTSAAGSSSRPDGAALDALTFGRRYFLIRADGSRALHDQWLDGYGFG